MSLEKIKKFYETQTVQWNAELRKRVATGVLGGALVIVLLVAGGRLGAAFFAAALSLFMISEFIEMFFVLADKGEKKLVLLGSSWLISFVSFWIPRIEYELLLMLFVGLFCYFMFTVDRYQQTDEQGKNIELLAHFKELMFSWFGMFYLAFLPLYLPLIRDYTHGVHWLMVYLLIIWGGDIGAYFAGRKWGKKKLFPLVSPKKTLEGAYGGIASSVLLVLVYKLIFFSSLSLGAAVIIPIFVGALAQLGDLMESFMKRACAKKDSGTLLPGHGGFLDRFDSFVIALPLMYVCTRMFG